MRLIGIGRNLGNFRETVLLHTYIVASMLCVSAYAVLYNWYFDLIVLFLLFISMGYELDFKLALILLYIYTLYNTILSILYYPHYQRLPTITTTTTAPNYKPNKQYKQPYMLTYTTYIYISPKYSRKQTIYSKTHKSVGLQNYKQGKAFDDKHKVSSRTKVFNIRTINVIL